jgi:hypothetical protein
MATFFHLVAVPLYTGFNAVFDRINLVVLFKFVLF